MTDQLAARCSVLVYTAAATRMCDMLDQGGRERGNFCSRGAFSAACRAGCLRPAASDACRQSADAGILMIGSKSSTRSAAALADHEHGLPVQRPRDDGRRRGEKVFILFYLSTFPRQMLRGELRFVLLNTL
eukprot:2604567-Pleurochrysis_carterae.AAC.4